jgi:hypothetical protein
MIQQIILHFANDGFYGNGASWIPVYSNAWLKVDLGGDFVIDTITFGRDRLDYFNDRDPGQFTVSVSSNDVVYANGNDASDSLEYTQIVDSSVLGYSGVINWDETIQVNFDPVNARFIKLEFTNPNVAIDEIQVFGPNVQEVDIDIKPGSDDNSINCKSKGVTPIAVLSDENLNARTIDIELVSMNLSGLEPIRVTESHNQLHLEDVNGDGLLDGIIHIDTSDICLFIPDGTPIRSTVNLTLSGQTTDDLKFEGSDDIVLKGKKILQN